MLVPLQVVCRIIVVTIKQFHCDVGHVGEGVCVLIST